MPLSPWTGITAAAGRQQFPFAPRSGGIPGWSDRRLPRASKNGRRRAARRSRIAAGRSATRRRARKYRHRAGCRPGRAVARAKNMRRNLPRVVILFVEEILVVLTIDNGTHPLRLFGIDKGHLLRQTGYDVWRRQATAARRGRTAISRLLPSAALAQTAFRRASMRSPSAAIPSR